MEAVNVCTDCAPLLHNLIYQQQLTNYILLVALGVGAAVYACYLMYRLIKNFI